MCDKLLLTENHYICRRKIDNRNKHNTIMKRMILSLTAMFMVLVLAVIVFGRYGLGYDSGAFIYARI